MFVRRLLVPMLALVAAIGTVSLVVVLQRRAQRTEAARVSVAQLQVQVSAIQSTEISQAITGTSPLQIARAATLRYAAVDRALASRARTDPIPEMAAARRALRQTRVAAIRIGQVSQRFQTRPSETVPPPAVAKSYAANADANDELQQALGNASRAYARKASATVGQADWGSVVGVAVLLGLFLVFYVRSEQARVSATRQANSDSLTGLGNRRRLYRDLAASQLEGSSSTIVLIDLDGFKQYNDSLGHLAGDELLSTIGITLKDAIGGGSSAYRLGGDEFLLRLEGRVDDDDVAQIIDTVRGHVSLSVGVSYGTAHLGPREPLDHAMHHADKMMYENKIRKRLASGTGVGGPNDRYAATVDYPTKISPG